MFEHPDWEKQVNYPKKSLSKLFSLKLQYGVDSRVVGEIEGVLRLTQSYPPGARIRFVFSFSNFRAFVMSYFFCKAGFAVTVTSNSALRNCVICSGVSNEKLAKQYDALDSRINEYLLSLVKR